MLSVRNLIDTTSLTADDITQILDTAQSFAEVNSRAIKKVPALRGRTIVNLFLEPSTRTKSSFELAEKRLSADSLSMGGSTSSVVKGESLADTIQTISAMNVDMFVCRARFAGTPYIISQNTDARIINAGDGSNQHPTQTLLDMYTIQQTQGHLDGLTINMVGDLKYGRTVHSLSEAMSDFSPNYIFTAPDELKMPSKYLKFLDDKNVKYEETASLEDHLNDCDILYMTRVQQERFPSKEDYDKVKDTYVLNASMLSGVKPNMKILHPLPRITEIATDVDDTPYAYYFQQARNGMYVRMAVISYLLGYR